MLMATSTIDGTYQKQKPWGITTRTQPRGNEDGIQTTRDKAKTKQGYQVKYYDCSTFYAKTLTLNQRTLLIPTFYNS